MDLRKRQYGSTYHNVDDDQPPTTEVFQADKGIVDYCERCEGVKIVDLTNLVQSFEDTCTVLAGMDMVICCDTAVGHLAGAMGIPVWMLIPFNPDWRWRLEGDRTPWYNSMRLFRQTERDNWAEVFERVESELHVHSLQNKR